MVWGGCAPSGLHRQQRRFARQAGAEAERDDGVGDSAAIKPGPCGLKLQCVRKLKATMGYTPITPTNVNDIESLQNRLKTIGCFRSNISLENELFRADEWMRVLNAATTLSADDGGITVWQNEKGHLVIIVLLSRDQAEKRMPGYTALLDDARRMHGVFIGCVQSRLYRSVERCLFAE